MTLTATPPIAPAEALDRLNLLLDLSGVRLKLADPEEGKGCDPVQLALMEGEYRKFLALHLAHPGADIVPCKIVDDIWHQHILDTAAYRADCDAIFGQFLDHYPYFGLRGEDDAQALKDAYADTLDRYRAAFGEPPEGTWISVDASRCTRKNCKPQKCK
jgi:hypothetical protein